MSSWRKLYCYSFKTQAEVIVALAVEDGGNSEREACYCRTSRLACLEPAVCCVNHRLVCSSSVIFKLTKLQQPSYFLPVPSS